MARADRYRMTAEESALAAVHYAKGEFLWMVGDKRIFLPEGLILLDAFMRNPSAPCVYFNSVWFDSDGHTNGLSSTHMISTRALTPYKQFVMRQGINFMATNMGAWIFERRLLDLDDWRQVIDRCGPHFSHVTTLLLGLRDGEALCHSAFLLQAEAKAYHAGDPSEWVRYAKLAGTYQFYAWTFGLVRQFRFLIERGAYSYGDVRRSMCSEGYVLRRQVDEIYIHLLSQLRLGRASPRERITAAELEELMDFLGRACPEKAIVNQMFRDLYAGTETDTNRLFYKKWMTLYQACLIDSKELRLSSLIVGQFGSSYIRLHPGGYVVSKVQDNSNFQLAYKLLDAPVTDNQWRILHEEDFMKFASGIWPGSIGDIYPIGVQKSVIRELSYRHTTRRIVVSLYRNRFAFMVISLLPERIKGYLRSILL
jgi:hypothetical protein